MTETSAATGVRLLWNVVIPGATQAIVTAGEADLTPDSVAQVVDKDTRRTSIVFHNHGSKRIDISSDMTDEIVTLEAGTANNTYTAPGLIKARIHAE